MATLVPIPTHPPESQFFQYRHCSSSITTKVCFHANPLTFKKAPSPPRNKLKLTSPLCSPSTSVVVEDPSPSPSFDGVCIKEAQSSNEDNIENLPLSGCKTCGREELERGCNGEGRIQGGIATVPGFGWWPIKAFRPCPWFVASGGRYRRRGQSMDEVTSGQGRREASIRNTDELQSSKKKPGPR